MEESLVLNLTETLVIEIVAEHEAAWLVVHSGDALDAFEDVFGGITITHGVFGLRIFNELLILSLLLITDYILPCLLIQLPLHQDVKEDIDSRIVR